VGGGVVYEVEHGAESADVKNCFIVSGLADETLQLLGFFPELLLGVLEVDRDGIGEELDGDGIEDCGAALGRSDGDGEVAGENIIWVCKFREIPSLY
jgi:hypothetical protein